MKPRYVPPDLVVGDPCWLLLGECLHEVTVTKIIPVLEHTPQAFAMYKVRLQEQMSYDWYFERESQHRSNLFLRPAERAQLIDRLDGDIDALNYLKRELEDSHEGELA